MIQLFVFILAVLFVIPLGICVWIAVTLIKLWKSKEILFPEEIPLTPICSENCGGFFDRYNLTMPFVKMRCYEKFMTIHYSDHLHLEYEDIDSTEKIRYPMSPGLCIYHHNPKIPRKIILWSFHCKKIQEIIQNPLKLF